MTTGPQDFSTGVAPYLQIPSILLNIVTVNEMYIKMKERCRFRKPRTLGGSGSSYDIGIRFAY